MKNVLIYFKEIVFIIVTLYAGYQFIKNNIVDKDRKLQSEIINDNKVKLWIKTDSLNTINNQHILDTLVYVAKTQAIIVKKVNNLNSGFTTHLKQAEKIDELINFYELK